jgi:DNA primase|tara:strand:+ start:232 stop:1152 length:921 start_codon:yes stop_codon:yes gene_type:complete
MNIKTVLQSILGRGKTMSNNEIAFQCPFCHHHKKKLQVNTESQKWQCWVCGAKGRSIYALAKKAGADQHILQKVGDLVGKPKRSITEKAYDILSLPKEFISFTKGNPKDPDFINAFHYLTVNRKITKYDILKYNIGYCDKGLYAGMIIIPSYDENGQLNFFTGRTYYSDRSFKHKNPKVSKDIIGFDLLINWNEPITIVEGAFDAIAVKRNAIPLFGKKLMDTLKTKMIEKQIKRVNIALDKDAINDALDICQYLISNGIEVYLVEMNDQDPSELGFTSITNRISESNPLTSSQLMQKKILGSFSK